MKLPLEAPVPNPLADQAVEIATVMLLAEQADNRVEGRAMEGAAFERMRWQPREPRLGTGLFHVCLLVIRKEIRAVGGPAQYLEILSYLAAVEAPIDTTTMVE